MDAELRLCPPFRLDSNNEQLWRGSREIRLRRKTFAVLRHLVEHPGQFFEDFAKAGASGMTVHAEATPHIHRDICRVKALGCWAGVVINPGTPCSAIEAIATEVDLVLIMSVDPGYGGQAFIPTSIEKIRQMRALLDNAGSAATLEVDGGINRETIARCAAAGADAFVAGHAIFSAADPCAEIGELRRRTMIAV